MFKSRSLESDTDNLINIKRIKKEDSKTRATRLALSQKVYETFIQIKGVKFTTPCVKSSFCKFNIDNNFQQVSKLCEKKSLGRHRHYWGNTKYRILIPSFKFSSQSSFVIDLCTYHGHQNHRVVGRAQFPIRDAFDIMNSSPHPSPRSKGKLSNNPSDNVTSNSSNSNSNNNITSTKDTNHSSKDDKSNKTEPNKSSNSNNTSNSVENSSTYSDEIESNTETKPKDKSFEIFNSQGKSLGSISMRLSCRPYAIPLNSVDEKNDPQYRMLLRSLERFHYY